MNVSSPSTRGHRPRRRRRLALSALLSMLGLTVSASAAFGGFDKLADSVRDHVYCKVVRDCVYDHPPETKIVAGPDHLTGDPKPTFKFDSDERGVRFKCRIDERHFHTCRNPYTSYRLKNGPHVLQVFAADRGGNADPTPAEREFVVDARSPNTEVHGSRVTRDRTPKFEIDSSERGARLQFKLDHRGGFRRTDEELELGKLKPGKHLLEVRSIDRAGNADRSPDKLRFKVAGSKRGGGNGHGGGR